MFQRHFCSKTPVLKKTEVAVLTDIDLGSEVTSGLEMAKTILEAGKSSKNTNISTCVASDREYQNAHVTHEW